MSSAGTNGLSGKPIIALVAAVVRREFETRVAEDANYGKTFSDHEFCDGGSPGQ